MGMGEHIGLESVRSVRAFERLDVFKYTVEPLAPTYRAIMAVFAQAKAHFRIQLRADEVRQELERAGYAVTLPEAGIDPLLDQLTEWGNLERSHDTGRVSTLADFYRRHYVYRLTAGGEAAELALGAVAAALASSGSLQKVMLGAILRNLQILVAQIGRGSVEPEPAAVYEAVFNVTSQFEALAENASTFMGKLHEVLEHGEVESETFVAYKQDIIAYLQEFVSELARMAPRIRDCLDALRGYGLRRLGQIAARADEAPDLGGSRDIAAGFAARLDGICRWFLGEDSDLATVELLRRAARGAINRILRVLERIHDQRFRQVNRTADLLRLAGWFTACLDDTAAHRLFQQAFGLYSARHFSERPADPGAVSAATSWWQGPAAVVSLSLRERGRSYTPSRAVRIVDYSATRHRLAAAHRDARAAQMRAMEAFCGRGPLRMSALGVLTSDELDALLALLDRLLSGAPAADGKRACRSGDGLYALCLEPPGSGAPATVRTERGALTLPDFALTVESCLPVGAPRVAAA